MLTSSQFAIETAGSKLGILLRNKAAVEQLTLFVKENGLEIACTEIERRGLMVSSADEATLNQIVAKARGIKGVDVIRRLTLEDLREEAEVFGQESVVTSVKGNGDRVHDCLLSRLGDTVVVKMILDAGFRSQARVLGVMLADDQRGRWVVTGYSITQYQTSLDGISQKGETKTFDASDYVGGNGEMSAIESCRDEVTEFKITGGVGAEKWIADRIALLLEQEKAADRNDAHDQTQSAINRAYDSFSRILYAMTGTAIKAAYSKFPLKQQPTNRQRGRHYESGNLSATFEEIMSAR